MPNGGSDCCGTCWFNNLNGGKPGYMDSHNPKMVVCTIRNIEIPMPFWTYCVNHPHHNPEKISIPIGRVFITDSYPYVRKVWNEAPDTEEIRVRLLELLDSFSENEIYLLSGVIDLQEEVIIQLTMIDEVRAVPGLLKLIKFNSENIEDQNKLNINNISTITGKSVEALLRLSGNIHIAQVKHLIAAGLEKFDKIPYNESEDDLFAVRYHLVRGLMFAGKTTEVRSLIDLGLNDPNGKIRETAIDLMKKE